MRFNILFRFLCTIALFVPSCKTPVIEQASIDEVLELFGGAFGYTQEGSVGTSGNKTTYMLQLQQSDRAEEISAFPALLTSGVALAFYSKLKDKDKCTFIQSEITFKSGDTLSKKFECQQIREANDNKHFFFGLTDLLKEQNYDSLCTLLASDSTTSSASLQCISQLKQVDEKAGKFKSAFLIGFIEVENEKGKFIRYTGMAVREKQTIPLTVLIDRKKQKIVYSGFKM